MDVEDLLEKLTVEEKVALTSGRHLSIILPYPLL